MIFRAIAVALICTWAHAQSTAQVQWVIGTGANDHWYQAVSSPMPLTWSEADQLARLAGGTLASINSAEETSFVFALVDAPQFWIPEGGVGSTNMGPWLGGAQTAGAQEPAGGWEWTDCTCLITYSSWLPGQPNNWLTPGFANEDRLHFCSTNAPTRSSMWCDIDGDQRAVGYVVEWLVDPRGQANSAQASLRANGAGASTIPGPHAQLLAQASALTFSWSGPPGMPYLLALGNAVPCAVPLGCYGCLDLTPAVILLDGSTPLGQLLFSLDPSGSASQTFLLPPLPPGTELSFQGLVLQPNSCGGLLTAAHLLMVR